MLSLLPVKGRALASAVAMSALMIGVGITTPTWAQNAVVVNGKAIPKTKLDEF